MNYRMGLFVTVAVVVKPLQLVIVSRPDSRNYRFGVWWLEMVGLLASIGLLSKNSCDFPFVFILKSVKLALFRPFLFFF